MSEAQNADFTERVVIDTTALPWQPSPSPSVFRKRLDLVGGAESGRVTSVVRYAPGSAFPAHGHPEGEEILVLEGVFSDEHGDYPAGSYLLNPPGFAHAPFSRPGAILFVKLRQFGGRGRRKVAIDSRSAAFERGQAPGIARLLLYRDAAFPETIELYRMDAGAKTALETYPGGEEIFVLEGAFEDEDGHYTAGTWLRLPVGSAHVKRSRGGATLYVKQGHLG
jgi:anti-sigma factor ChrR (cupin superfamily)